jgi:hypothetical protein
VALYKKIKKLKSLKINKKLKKKRKRRGVALPPSWQVVFHPQGPKAFNFILFFIIFFFYHGSDTPDRPKATPLLFSFFYLFNFNI